MNEIIYRKVLSNIPHCITPYNLHLDGLVWYNVIKKGRNLINLLCDCLCKYEISGKIFSNFLK